MWKQNYCFFNIVEDLKVKRKGEERGWGLSWELILYSIVVGFVSYKDIMIGEKEIELSILVQKRNS